MANNYWIKLYHEILQDPKMARLPDRIWRRVIELFLAAGECGDTGNLPDTADLAWSLRVSEKVLLKDLEIIEKLGIIEKTSTGWLVVNFEKRNAATTGKDRVRNFRETKRKNDCNADVTGMKRNCNEDVTKSYTDIDIDKDIDKEDDDNARARVFEAWENEIEPITSFMAEKLKSALKDYPADWIVEAVHLAVENNARNWRYVHAILKNWKAKGFRADTRTPKQQARQPVNQGLEAVKAMAAAEGIELGGIFSEANSG